MKTTRMMMMLAAAGSVLLTIPAMSGGAESADLRKKARKLQKAGNWKEALDVYRNLVTDEANAGKLAAQDLDAAVQCLQNLGTLHELDALLESAVAAHSDDWRVLRSAANSYSGSQHDGFMVAGEFHRGHHRGGGKRMYAWQRDRVRAMQLMGQALASAENEKDNKALADAYLGFASMLKDSHGYGGAWRLQYLTDTSELPDYAESWSPGSRDVGTPVDADGKPVFYHIPKSWDAAKNDGERWRWLLVQTQELDPGRSAAVMYLFAHFLRQQFSVETLARGHYGGWFARQGGGDDDGRKDESGTWELHTLKESETICRLASGVKRIALPDEFNHIVQLKRVAEMERAGQNSETALHALAEVFENRRQYPTAARYWKKSIDKYGALLRKKWKREKLKQIVDNFCRFDGTMTHPAGTKPKMGMVFRNGSKVQFTANKIDVPKLLGDVKKYLKSNPVDLKHERINVGSIGYSLVNDYHDRYVGNEVAKWNLELKPRPNHWDKRVEVEMPLSKSGAYLVKAQMADGNSSHIVVWIEDVAIVKKPMDKKSYYFLADAVTGAPIGKANVEFFGYRMDYLERKRLLNRRRYNVITENFSEFSDKDGQVTLTEKKQPRQFQWLVTARTEDGRSAYHGFSNVWYGNYRDAEYRQTKFFTITDRPVYRPSQEVQFKTWVRHAQYDKDDVSQFAKKDFRVEIKNPKGEKVFEKVVKTDAYGGLEGTLLLEDEATLGQYHIAILTMDRKQSGGNHFRVEEYKKPEFEVKVEAPKEPVMLGERIPATIEAKYYFGAPVQQAKVKYKVLRYENDSRWFAPMSWDWFYGTGYWWFAYDYEWYPGWNSWGCRRPIWSWWPRNNNPPEVVLENEVEIGEDGTVKVEIDTALAKEIHGDIDHRYEITAEVRDASRRTIVGKGSVIVARKPFKVNMWVDRGYYRVGEVVNANVCARTPDGKGVEGQGKLTLFKIGYDKDRKPVETEVASWALNTDGEGCVEQQLKASEKGQYRLSYKLTDKQEHTIEGGYVFVVRGDGFDGKEFRFNELEVVTDKREYAPGEKVKVMVNTDRTGSTVLLFIRPSNGTYLLPKVLRLSGKSTVHEIAVVKRDMPNFFIEVMTVSGGKIFSDMREVVVPPEKRVLNVEVLPSETQYKPGEHAKVKVRLSDFDGKPYIGSTVVTIYDKALEYISGGSNVPEIRAFFWKWRRRHTARREDNLARSFANVGKKGQMLMRNLGIFGHGVADEAQNYGFGQAFGGGGGGGGNRLRASAKSAVPAAAARSPMTAGLRSGRNSIQSASIDGLLEEMDAAPEGFGDDFVREGAGTGEASPEVTPVVRTNFADLAFWTASLTTDENGIAEVELDMPENLTTWKIKTWGMGHGTNVGQGETEVITSKNLLIRMQAPRFFVEKDEVVLSANVHNYLESAKDVRVVLELGEDGSLASMDGIEPEQKVRIEAGGEERIDWRVKVLREGQATITMKALTDEESDAMQMSYPVFVHGMLKTESYSGALRPEDESGKFVINVPAERRPEQSMLEVRYSPTIATAMVDALPYLASYPYGCTEQTLNRFVPTVITQKILVDMGVNLADVKAKRTNLNPQEIGDDRKRAEQWKRWKENPVFDDAVVGDMVAEGVKRLTNMQNRDGGWGWFSGHREKSYPHTTAVVVHGLQVAKENDMPIVPGVIEGGVIEGGVRWLKKYQAGEVQRIRNWKVKLARRKKPHADNLDAFVFMILCDAGEVNGAMGDFLYRDRKELAVYGKAMTGLAMHKIKRIKERDMLVRNIEQFLKTDDENQTAWLELGNNAYWWQWYGSEFEAQAYYLKLLAAVKPKSKQAGGLVKYLVNNRKHATYWNSTRDTAVCIEALADYIRASGEDAPDMTVEILMDGKKMKEVAINKSNLFTYDNKLVLVEDAVDTGEHTIEFRKKGTGPLYYNAYLTNFTLEDHIEKAGLEIKVARQFYKLTPVDKSIKAVGSRGQAVDQKVEKYTRTPLSNEAVLKSGDLVEIELVMESKNDYEYIVFEDMKASGFEPFEVRSGYTANGLGAYMELRDEKVAFFVRQLARGKHSLAYRMRAEIPGKFSALPTRGSAMYAPELKANSDEFKVGIVD